MPSDRVCEAFPGSGFCREAAGGGYFSPVGPNHFGFMWGHLEYLLISKRSLKVRLQAVLVNGHPT